MSRFRRWLGQPLPYYVLLGAAVFAVDVALRRPPEPLFTPEAVRHEVAAQLQESLGRPPDAQEHHRALGEWLDTELLYREAMSLELHHNDEVVRNHLASKLRHMVREATVPDQPSDAELEAQLESHRERYTVQDSYTLTSVFLLRRPDTSTEQHRERVDSVLAQLRAGAAPEGLGDHFPRGPHFSKLPRAYLEQVFGAPLKGVLSERLVNTWQAVDSRRGTHLILVRAVHGGQPELESMRSALAADLHAQKQEAALLEYSRKLRVKYQVAPIPQPAPVPSQAE